MQDRPQVNQWRIADHAMIGNCRSSALVARDGSITWMCCPRFDSPAIFAGLLGTHRNGFWQITVAGAQESHRQYIYGTNVLETFFRSASGVAKLTDLMTVCEEQEKRSALVADHEVLREVRCMEGEVNVSLDFFPRLDYGKNAAKLRPSGTLGIRMEVGRGLYWLRGSHALQCNDERATASFTLRAGEVANFSLSYSEDAPAVLPELGAAAAARIKASVDWWLRWSRSANYQGEYRDAIIRSALVLKLLSYAPSGAITAAATTSLPEQPGGGLNWDYRYCWLRDASMTVRALEELDFWDEAEAFLEWMLLATRLSQPKLNPMYTVFGENAPREHNLDHLCGYAGSRPVRVGNGARKQLQLDVYGQVIDAVAHLASKDKHFDRTTQKVITGLGKFIIKNWCLPDDGIWEPREPQQMRTHSRLMCWVALDSLATLAHDGVIPRKLEDEYIAVRKRIRADIENNAWNAKLNAYTSTFGGDAADAALLLFAWSGFAPADSPRIAGTYDYIATQLRAGDGLLYRYRRPDPEGAFAICSFWEVQHLVAAGRVADAEKLFKTMLSYANDVGLFAEEIDPTTGDPVGNFPQAFTHIGLISAALALHKSHESGTERRSA